jgi:hypothetical protein
MRAAEWVDRLGGRFSAELGIDLAADREAEITKWFLAAILFGTRISKVIAANTYRAFERAGVLTPQQIMQTGWDGLVRILDAGGYVRYDFKTATKLLDVFGALRNRYGTLETLHAVAADARDLENRLKGLGKGVGEVTVGIFLREMRGVWEKAQPPLSPPAIAAAKDLGLLAPPIEDPQAALGLLMERWIRDGGNRRSFADFEAALVRHGLALRHRHRRSP